LLKAVLVANDPTLISDEKLKVPKIHDLVHLARMAGVEVQEDELDLLDRLTMITTWSGRYPVAKTMDAFRAVGIHREAIIVQPADAFATIVTLAKRLREKLAKSGYKIVAKGGGAVVVWAEPPADE
jgi:hypothetical protein